MKLSFRIYLCVSVCICGCLPAFAAIRGVVSNATTGKTVSGVEATLLKLEGGMIEIGKASSDAQGVFRIEAPPPSGDLPYLLRAEYRGVTYFAPARAQAGGGDIDVRVQVFDTTTDRAAVKLEKHQVVVEPRPGRLLVAEIYTVRNTSSPPKTLSALGASKDTFPFTIAEGKAEEVQASVSGGSQMPLRQTVLDRGNGSYALDYPFRPGETRVEVSYRLPYDVGFAFHKAKGNASLTGTPETTVIAPMDVVTITSPDLTLTNKDASQGAAYYTWKTPGAPLSFEIQGTLPEAAADNPSAGGEGRGEADQLQTVESPNFVLLAGWKILIVLAIALALGLGHLYRLDAGSKAAASRK